MFVHNSGQTQIIDLDFNNSVNHNKPHHILLSPLYILNEDF